jgi:hypothetical protein
LRLTLFVARHVFGAPRDEFSELSRLGMAGFYTNAEGTAISGFGAARVRLTEPKADAPGRQPAVPLPAKNGMAMAF